jgi:fermentation-respiration switch protein FrsA (DUF1100 family)
MDGHSIEIKRFAVYPFALWMVLLALVLAGCGEAPAQGISTATLSPSPAATSTRRPASLTPTPTATQRPPTLTPTITPSPTPTPLPMSILGMRARTYPGSDIVIEEELAAGSNYHRYYASYLSDGLKIYALLTIPNGEMPAGGWPAIIFNHGYIPPKEYRTTERYVAYVDRLARAGYIVFRIDYRGNDRSEGIATGAYGSPGYTIDVLNAVASIKRFPKANPQKIGMWGHSMGGFLTLRAMVISRDIKAGVIWAGVVGSYADMFYNWRHAGPTPTPRPTPSGWRSEWTDEYGTPEQNPQFWDSISANAYLADLSGPIQLHHGTADTEVPPAFSETLAKEIRDSGGTVELYTYEGDDHNLSKWFTLTMNRTIEFFDRYLK